MRTRLILGGVAVALVTILLLAGGPAEAKKPPKPPPEPPPPVDGGTIYLRDLGVVYSMKPDGSDRTALFPIEPTYPCEPSTSLHTCAVHEKSERWFLQLRPYDSTPGDGIPETYPDDVVRHELFAVCEGGAAIRLTDDADLEPNNHTGDWTNLVEPRWVHDGSSVDGEVSYLAKKWSGGSVVAWGVYVLDIDPDNLSSHTAGAPTRLDVTPLELVGIRVVPDHDWSPDGTSFVYRRWRSDFKGLYRADYDSTSGTWSTTELISEDDANGFYTRAVRWAPAASRILFQGGAIYSMDPYDATDLTVVIEAPGPKGKTSRYVQRPFWSPNATHIVYWRQEYRHTQNWSNANYVYRATASGGDNTQIGTGVPLGWRGP